MPKYLLTTEQGPLDQIETGFDEVCRIAAAYANNRLESVRILTPAGVKLRTEHPEPILVAKPVAVVSPDVANWLDPNGALQRAGLMRST
jgi:hypothetical protein